MKNTPSKNNRNYSPTKIGDTLGNMNKRFLNKFGKLDYVIHAKWSEIVGPFFSKHSEPIKVNHNFQNSTNIDEKKNEKILLVAVTPSAAIEFQHFQNKIIEKINSYFGYKLIGGIRIQQKILDNEIIPDQNNKIRTKIQNKETLDIKKNASIINDKDLEKSIVELGLSIARHKK